MFKTVHPEPWYFGKWKFLKYIWVYDSDTITIKKKYIYWTVDSVIQSKNEFLILICSTDKWLTKFWASKNDKDLKKESWNKLQYEISAMQTVSCFGTKNTALIIKVCINSIL